ncbi:MAG: hypothetical protein MI863_13370 [Desulfobacterales bacterium]|nr:hypothetical protein [Desulfobacterales bacterium]
MDELTKKANKLYFTANDKCREASLNWVRTVVAILTPSLALLIGLQEKNENFNDTLRYVLVVTIILLATTIVIGLIVLKTEEIGWTKKRDKIQESWNKEQKLHLDPVILSDILSKHAVTAFSFCSFSSIISLAIFGILKFML